MVHHCLVCVTGESPIVFLVERQQIERAFVLVAPLRVLLHRARQRRRLVPVLRPERRVAYDRDLWRRRLAEADLSGVYAWWVELLELGAIHFEVLDSSAGHYRRLTDRQIPRLLAS